MHMRDVNSKRVNAMAEYPIVIVPLAPEDGGGFAAYAPDLDGCMSDGETPEQAAENVAAAILEWLDEYKRLGREVPQPGSAARAVTEERKQLFKVLEKQDAVLEKQDQVIKQQVQMLAEREAAFNRLRSDADVLRARLSELLEAEDKLTPLAAWSRSVPAFVVHARKRSGRDGERNQ
jgi:antitoxin HicB